MANQLEDAYVQNLKDNLTKQADSFYDALVENTTRSHVPEDLFRDYFLPYFINEVPISSNPEVISKWIGIAGTPMSKVDVVNDADEVIYTVPSLFDTTIINSSERRPGDSIADISAEFDLKNNNIPAVAQSFLSQQLDRKLSIVDQNRINSQARQEWSDIFKRYGINKKLETPQLNSTEVVDDVEYD